jgi:tetratricopeptide (TPR) repeat protein
MSDSSKRFRVAFSFAGEKRAYVAETAGLLASRFGEAAILYDKYHEAEFSRGDLGFYLPDLYHGQSDLIVVVVCKDYDTKEWPGLEWRAIFDLLKKRKDHEVMLCRFDHAEVRGLYSTAGFVDLDDKTPDVAATRILERLALNEGKPKNHYVSNPPTTMPRGDFRAAPSRLFGSTSSGSDLLVGRETELADLDAAWSGPAKKNVVTIVAWGGVGKTSLVAHWAANTLANPDHGDVERYFDWSFFSQGTRSEGDATGADKAASADIFVKEALEFFGDPDLAKSNAGGWEKGERLARLVAEQRTLLILDGLEPLQDAKSGELQDQALRALLRGLAADNRGLCIVTTRQKLPELNMWHSTTAPEWVLARLSKSAGAELLKKLGVVGTPTEREQLAADIKGHALTLTLLGKYLAEAHGGDIRRRDLVSLSEADFEETSGHAFQVIREYERWLGKDGRHIELAVLRLLGLFDRPATPDCLVALRTAPLIPGLTETLVPLTEARWNVAVKRLVRLGLVEEQPWAPRRIAGYSKDEAAKAKAGDRLGKPQPFPVPPLQTSAVALDAHPLIREYFGRRLRETSAEAWQMAHSRLFEHLRDSAPYWPEGLEGLQPLYQAVAHGCQAGRYQETCDEVYRDRILRGTSGSHGFYSTFKLGSISADLAAVGCFFVTLWIQPMLELSETDQAWLLAVASFHLRALGRLTEAREPMLAGLERDIEQENWKESAISAGNLSELDLTLGDVASAVREAEQSVEFADKSGDAFHSLLNRTTHADALYQAGRKKEAEAQFEEAERIQRESQPDYPSLYSLQGFRFCDLLLAEAERDAWRTLECAGLPALSAEASPRLHASSAERLGIESGGEPPHSKALSNVDQRAIGALPIAERNQRLLDMALDHLTLGRVALYRAILEPSSFDIQNSEAVLHVDAAVDGLRQSGNMDDLPRGLLTRAWLHALQGRTAGARTDLDEAQQIAERGPMPLHLADVHLHRARLFFRDDPVAARKDLARARELIVKHGYLRRMEELEDAEKVILAG